MAARNLSLIVFLGVAACGGAADAPVAVDRSDVAAKAVADVDAAMAEATAGEAPARVSQARPAN